MEGKANYVPLTPISFLDRASLLYGQRVSIVFGGTTYSWKQTKHRCINIASALSQLGIVPGDIVGAVAPNIPELYELHFAVPMAGAVLCALNTKLNANALAFKLGQLEAKAVFVYHESVQVAREAFVLLSQRKINLPLLIIIQDQENQNLNSTESMDYNKLLALGKDGFKTIYPNSEFDPISVCYTSGSTGEPKGVIYSHRATYLRSLGETFLFGALKNPVFLWTVDMFRCNGWCFPWIMAALGGTNVCMRYVTGRAIFDSVALHNVTHFCGLPTLLTMMAEVVDTIDPDQFQGGSPHEEVNVTVAGAGVLPESQVLIKLRNLGFVISTAYGMSEALGPVISKTLTPSHQDGTFSVVHSLVMEGLDVKDPITMESIPADGKTIGEVMFKGNALMLGYMKNVEGTEAAFNGGWYRTRDLGVKQQDGYIQVKDRSVDALVSRGEIISSLEIEEVICRHPMVLEAAVVRKADEILGEIPCAFVKLKEGCVLGVQEIRDFCANHLAENMRPQHVFFRELPRNCTGKVQKYVLRDLVMRNVTE